MKILENKLESLGGKVFKSFDLSCNEINSICLISCTEHIQLEFWTSK